MKTSRHFGPETNLVLIGMPGAGKSTIGVLLAKALSRDFLDTDLLIQAHEGRRLQALLDELGPEAFCRLEERHLLGVHRKGCVIATGGSAIYSPSAMRHLRRGGLVVHLDLPLATLRRRLTDLAIRGVVMPHGSSLSRLYAEREPLYRRYADLTIDCRRRTHEQIVEAVLKALDRRARSSVPSTQPRSKRHVSR